ncbi:hypothetical protein SteCoe_21001 [Stentor coeruleus]|uniref:phenylalanine 4-monooxygenase n=1 Tax=Stentor coeruleus TaxID=5963 RepID=A0A1R2BQR0_9CILI|nr:hypothetical protein SteCoe_21001 [Stentor coeruleus]
MRFRIRNFSYAQPIKDPIRYFTPKSIYDLDKLPKNYEDFVNKLGSNYPGYNDPAYMSWLYKVRNAPSKIGEVNKVEYNDDHILTWSTVYSKLRHLHDDLACDKYKENFRELEELGILSEREIPNFATLNKYLTHKSGFQLVNVGGMIKPRFFLYGLAFKVFFTTQYIRHKSVPFYASEPDIIHEILGHVPMLADRKFAELFQEIGEKSLGAPDHVIDVLGRAYFFIIEFGILSDKVLGAGILSSSKEIEIISSGKAKIEDWSLQKIINSDLILSDYQPQYIDVVKIENLKEIFAEVYNYLKI